MLALLLVLILSAVPSPLYSEPCWEENQANHQVSDFKNESKTFQYLALEIEQDLPDIREILEPLCHVRPPQSEGSQLVRNFVQLLLEFGLEWEVELDTFTTTTLPPYSEQFTFTNIVATQDPTKPRLLTLACHYDSKRFPVGFQGATDSAAPCAIILHVALALDSLLKEGEVSLQLVMFDGEETLYNNTMFGPDGLYGSKYMAAKWAETPYSCSPGPWCQSGEASLMQRIDLLVLLDLIGAPHPTFHPYTDPLTLQCDEYARELSRLEDVLLGENSDKFFSEECTTVNNNVDDHTPFLEQGLRRALHVISDPFPQVWHTLEDNMEHLDYETIDRINRIIRIFVAEYLNIDLPSQL